MTDLDYIAASAAAATGMFWADMPEAAKEIYRQQTVGVLDGVMALAGSEAEAGEIVNRVRHRKTAKVIALETATDV